MRSQLEKIIIGTVIHDDALGYVNYLKAKNFTGVNAQVWEIITEMTPITFAGLTQRMREAGISNVAEYVGEALTSTVHPHLLPAHGLMLMELNFRAQAINALMPLTEDKSSLIDYTESREVMDSLMDSGQDVFETIQGAARYFEQQRAMKAFAVMARISEGIDRRVDTIRHNVCIASLERQLSQSKAVRDYMNEKTN